MSAVATLQRRAAVLATLPCNERGELDVSPEAIERWTPEQLAAWIADDAERELLDLIGWGADVAAFYEGCE